MQGELEGSARYRELTKSAENFFKQSFVSTSRWELWLCVYVCVCPITLSICLNIDIMCIGSEVSVGEEVLQLLHSCIPFNMEDLKKQESQLPQEDSEWKWTSKTFYLWTTPQASEN